MFIAPSSCLLYPIMLERDKIHKKNLINNLNQNVNMTKRSRIVDN